MVRGRIAVMAGKKTIRATVKVMLTACVLGANKRTLCESDRSYRRKAREGVKSLITWVGE